MGKAKKGKTDKATAAAALKCHCDHPFQCDCGNRPERPSRGHKWDSETQEWGGKGHRQKGGSGQTGMIAEQAKVTEKGNTSVAQWQRLPSQILQEVCKRDRRPNPKFKDVHNNGNKGSGPKLFKYRCIVPDSKDDKKDLFFVPANGVSNEEQAKEEAALLGLLMLTPKLPHERRFPEPYKTTWLVAVQALKYAAKSSSQSQQRGGMKIIKDNSNSNISNNNGNSSNNNKNNTGGGGNNKASSNTNLVLGSKMTSHADQRRLAETKRQERNAKIHKHEAVRMANRDHPVFLSANLRGQIQRLLRGDTNLVVLEDNVKDNATTEDMNTMDDMDMEESTSDRQAYVEKRLHQEGFTNRQARTAFFKQTMSSGVVIGNTNNDDVVDEDLWETLYDDCLQWLCVHLEEDQLPEGFDPRGHTLDVVSTKNSNDNNNDNNNIGSHTKSAAAAAAIVSPSISPQAKELALKFGLVDQDAAWLLLEQQQNKKSGTVEEFLWTCICKVAGTNLDDPSTTTATIGDEEHNKCLAQEEMEALDAIFPSDCQITTASNGYSTITIHTPEELKIEIVVADGKYPAAPPQQVLLSGAWPERIGVVIHVEIVKFLSTLALGEPMVFEIYGQLQLLLQTAQELEKLSLVRALGPAGSSPATATATPDGTTKSSDSKPKEPTKIRPAMKLKRPRERGFFWSTHPKKTPPAVAFPKLSTSLENQRKGLPAGKARSEFLSVLKHADDGSRVVLVTGDTGCGKTTQIPQFILEEAPNSAKIVVAQPRRLAATGVADRVANERGESEAGKKSVGYVVRGATAMCQHTRLLFCTFGVLLRQLQCDGALDNITHIVIDEVHERNLDGDILMGLLKQFLVTTPHLRVVLMSATLDADRFAAYWGNNTPRMHIPGRTFPVTDFLLEDVLSITGYIPPKNGKKKKFGYGNQQRPRKASPWGDSERSDDEDKDGEDKEEEKVETAAEAKSQTYSIPLEDLVKRVDETRIDYDLLGQLVRQLVLDKTMGKDGSILVFLPGAPEINQAKTAVGKICGGMPVLLLPLHGGLQPKDQNLVFRPSSSGVKVILSTNVAETSITIPDCTVVIDTCREKQSSYDPSNRMPLLLEQFASRASLKQRRGRAGRVREGKCYKLISQATYSKLNEHSAPEITRCALDQTLLSLLFLGVERGSGTFLRTLLDPPGQEAVDAAIFSLWKLGAVEKQLPSGDLPLTPLGMHLAGIPAPPVVGKMLVMGSILGCRQGALAMAAGISVGRSPFLRIDDPSFSRRRGGSNGEEESIEEMKNKRILEERAKLFKKAGNSDHAMLAGAYLDWESLGDGGGKRKQYCDTLGLNGNGMRDILKLVNQLGSSLRSAGYVASEESDRNAHSWRILRACVVSSMAPGQLVRVHRPSTKYVDTAEGALEKDGKAKELKFFIRPQDDPEGNVDPRSKEERVFMHPSSANFAVGNYSCPWLVYHSMVRTSKSFLRDATECSAYALLLFGGQLDVQARNGVIVVDDWVKLSANARIGALIRGLREKMDDLLAQKIKDPNIDIGNSTEMKLIVKLLVTDGLGN